MREHLVLTILMQIKSLYSDFVEETHIKYAPKLDEKILDYEPENGFIDARLLRDDNLADNYFDLINEYKKYYRIYKEKTIGH